MIQLIVTAGIEDGHFAGLGARLFNVFCFFTVQANLIVAVTCLLLAVRLDQPSAVFRVFRLTGVVAIAITFVVFHVALAGLQDLEGSAAVADFLLHTGSPTMCVGGWLVFGPRGMVTGRIVGLSCVFPICWAIFVLIRGPVVDFYPYPFVDVRDLGYPRVVLNILHRRGAVHRGVGRGEGAGRHPRAPAR